MAKASISVCKGKGSIAHNNRDFLTVNVDKNRTSDNITYVSEPLEVAYEKCFGQAIKEYNERQKRADRQISGARGYMEQVRTSGNGEKLFYEIVVQVGNMQDSHVGTPQGDLCAKILDEYMRDFQERNPNLYVFNSVLHMDEQTPHLHIDYIPLAHGYQRGLGVRNSLDRAFLEQGFDGKANKYENRTIAWQRAEKDRIEEVMLKHGLEREEERGIDRDHMTVEQYKAVAEQVKNEVATMPQQIEVKSSLLQKSRVSVRKDDLERLVERAKLSEEHEKATKEIVSAIQKERQDGSEYIARKMSFASRYESEREMAQVHAVEEHQKAVEMREKYEKLYSAQQSLNEDYAVLYKAFQSQKQTIADLQSKNNSLRDEMRQMSDAVKGKIKSMADSFNQERQAYKTQIADLEGRLRGVFEKIADVVKAFGLLKYGKENEYRANLTDKQSRLFDAVEEHITSLLRAEKHEDLAVDIEQNVGISKEIGERIDALTPKRSKSHERE